VTKARALDDQMDFDHVVRVHTDGTVTDALTVSAPELYDDELSSQDWQLMDGYSGQYGYSGPIMHASEFIGEGLARDILATPGLYVALVDYATLDGPDDDSVSGWAVAFREAD
jgi:hypothetical protein